MNTFTTLAILVGIASSLDNVNAGTPRLRSTPQPLGAGWDQVVATFPQGVWDGSCDATTLRFLPDACTAALNENSTDGEKLACNIITAPDSLGMFPFGMYPTATLLTEDVKLMTPARTTPIFSDCAQAQMIQDGCFSFRALTDYAEHRNEKFTTSDEYVSQVSDSFGVDVSASIGYGPITARASYSEQSKRTSSMSRTSKVASVSQSWSNIVGQLSMGTCVSRTSLANYLSPEYVSKWNTIANMDANTLQNDATFQELMRDGFYVPYSFDYEVHYSANVRSTYEMTSTGSINSMTSAFSASLEVSYLLASASLSTSMSKAISDTASQQSVSTRNTATDSAYGDCKFVDMLSGDGSQWTSVMSECAIRAATNLETLQQPSKVSKNGFKPIVDILRNSDIKLPADLVPAMNKYFTYCECDEPWNTRFRSGHNSFTCYRGDGQQDSTGFCSTGYACQSVFWYQRDGTDGVCIRAK